MISWKARKSYTLCISIKNQKLLIFFVQWGKVFSNHWCVYPNKKCVIMRFKLQRSRIYWKKIELLIDYSLQSEQVFNINIRWILSFPYLSWSHALVISNINFLSVILNQAIRYVCYLFQVYDNHWCHHKFVIKLYVYKARNKKEYVLYILICPGNYICLQEISIIVTMTVCPWHWTIVFCCDCLPIYYQEICSLSSIYPCILSLWISTCT